MLYKYGLLYRISILFTLVGSSQASAQNPSLIPTRSNSYDSVAVRIAAEKADTGRWMPGYQDLSRYNTPSFCLAAIRRLTSIASRTGERDTIELGSSADTAVTKAMEFGRSCASKQHIATISPIEHYSFQQLLIYLNDTIRLDSLIAHQISSAPNEEEPVWILKDVVHSASQIRPMRHHIIDKILARLDTLGERATEPWADAISIKHRVKWLTYDTVSMWWKYSQDLYPKLNHFTGDIKSTLAYNIHLDSIERAWYKREDNLAIITRQYMEQSFREYPSTLPSIAIFTLLEQAEHHAAISKTNAQSFQGGRWLPEGENYQFPERGKVTVVHQVLRRTVIDRTRKSTLSDELAQLLRLKRMYGDRLDVVLRVPTSGYMWSSPPLTLDEEARGIKWLYHDYFKLPFKLFIDERIVHKMKDGKLVREEIQDVALGQAYLYIVDKNQRIYHFWDTPSEARLKAYVKRALEEEVDQPALASKEGR